MTTKLGKELYIQDYLINRETDLGAFYMACIQEDPGDGSLVGRCLYKPLRPDGRLTFETIFRISRALQVKPPIATK